MTSQKLGILLKSILCVPEPFLYTKLGKSMTMRFVEDALQSIIPLIRERLFLFRIFVSNEIASAINRKMSHFIDTV